MAFPKDEQVANPKEEIVDLINQDLNKTRRRLSEIKDQIDSMQSSVEREQNRYSNIATELRSIKDNLDTTPREDIREKYDEALEIRFRLATMRGQLEKFESTHDYLEQHQGMLNQILAKLQGISALPQSTQEEAKASADIDIVGIIQAQEDERKRLARAMHDGPAQSLTNFILQAEICQRLFDRSPERAGEELVNLKTNASKTFQKVRDFIFDLRPMMLDDLGLAPTVRRYVESFKDKNEIGIDLEVLGEERRLKDYVEVTAFRSLQDMMAITRDYAHPTELEVRLDMAPTVIRLVVTDNGKGFNTLNLFNKGEDESSGDPRMDALNMLKNKVELIGGSIEVESSENGGTSVRIEIPTGN